MGARRRNSLSRRDALPIVVIALVSGVLGALAGCAPTGTTAVDAVLTAAYAAAVTWAAATAPWWSFVAGGGLAALGSVGEVPLVAVGVAAALGGGALGVTRNSLPLVRSATGAAVVQVALRLPWDAGTLAPWLLAAGAAWVVAFTGLDRRPRHVRRTTAIAAAGVAGFGVLALAGLLVGGGMARSSASDGYDELVAGLRAVRAGETTDASASLRAAATQLREARESWTAPWSQPARLVPVLAQNREALADVLSTAAEAADAAATTLGLIQPEQLRVVGGVVDVEALALLAVPLADLERTAADLADALDRVDTPWLLAPFQSRLDTARTLAADVAREAHTTSGVARTGPAILGADGQRRYLIAFTNPSEARGQSGLMGSWAEITVSRGALRLGEQGRTGDLISALAAEGGGRLTPVPGDLGDEFFARYGRFGAGERGGKADSKFLSNVTMSPHAPTVGRAMAELYTQATGRTVDGVVVVDPAGLAALLQVTGSISVPDIGVRLDANTVERFLLLDQYDLPEAEREDLLEAVSDATVRRVLAATLPAPPTLAASLAPAALGGHLTLWFPRADEQALVRLTGADGSMPALDGRDGIAVVNDNASGNKIDSFLDRSVAYRARVDERSGAVQATLTVELRNEAPTTGYPDYVIGNLVDLPIGTNRTLLSVYSPLAFTSATLDGEPLGLSAGREQGWWVYTAMVDIPAGGQRTVELALAGRIAAGEYALVLRPQPLPQPERWSVEVGNQRGTTVAGIAGTVGRRSVLDRDGLGAWRPADANP